jgi:hypothetical protein
MHGSKPSIAIISFESNQRFIDKRKGTQSLGNLKKNLLETNFQEVLVF